VNENHNITAKDTLLKREKHIYEERPVKPSLLNDATSSRQRQLLQSVHNILSTFVM